MLERDRLSLAAFRKELAEQEEKERIERERPLREAEAELAHTAKELGKLTRDLICGGKDPELYVDPATIGSQHAMTVEEARRFNGEQAQRFVAKNPWFYRCEQNQQALLDYFERNELQLVTAEMLQRAVERLRDFGLLLDTPMIIEPDEPEPEQEAQTTIAEPDEVEGFDWHTGRPKTFTRWEVERMSADEYRRAFQLSPRFIYPTR